MDANQARAALGLTGVAPLTAQQVENAYATASSRYRPEAYREGSAERASLEQWQTVLAEARAVLLAEAPVGVAHWAPEAAAVATPPHPAPVPVPHKRGLSTGAIVGIVLGSVGVVGAFIAVIVVVFAMTVQSAIAAHPLLPATPTQTAVAGDLSAAETGFTFPVGMRRLEADDPAVTCGFDNGCWKVMFLPEQDCFSAQVDYAFGDADGTIRENGSNYLSNLVTGIGAPFAFGSSTQYEDGWIVDVTCIDETDPLGAAAGGFSSPAEIEWVDDPDASLCGAYEWCWAAIITPEDSCASAIVTYGFSYTDSEPATTSTATIDGLVAGRPSTFAFGSDEAYDYGWVVDYECIGSTT